MDPYILPDFPNIRLKNPTSVLQEAMEKVRRDRKIYRAKYILIDELYQKVIKADLKIARRSWESWPRNLVQRQARRENNFG